MQNKNIVIKGAREHNLKNIDLTIPRDKLVVFTGLSGSGKSSLAFDTIFAEGQRRYVESLSSYARQFLGQMEKPRVDYIDGLSPAISIDQKTTSKNPRSTVGTVTEIYDYLRLLFARAGTPHCPVCGKEIKKQTVDMITDDILGMPEGTKLVILSPVVRGRKGEYTSDLSSLRKSGFVRVRIDGITYELSENIKLDKNIKHTIEVVVDRIIVKPSVKSRIADSVEISSDLSGGLTLVSSLDGVEKMYSLNYACPDHGVSVEELSPRMFSFNNPYGACSKCSGLGVFLKVNTDLIVPDKSLSINEGAIVVSGWSNTDGSTIARMYYSALADEYGFSLDTPFCNLPDSAKEVLFYGTKGKKLKMNKKTAYGEGFYYSEFEGIVNNVERRYATSSSDAVKSEIEQYMTSECCPECGGTRLKKESVCVTFRDKNIYEITSFSVNDALTFFNSLTLNQSEEIIVRPIVTEVINRLSFLASVGLDYLSLNRASLTLSGGESQRIRLATQIGSSLVGVLYILDEPSIGLHQKDNARLINTLKNLRDNGNTVIVVEHDEETMLASDYIVDVGPGAGIHGGNIVFSGPPSDLLNCTKSITGDYLSGKKKITVPETRRTGNGNFLEILGASENNLKDIDVRIPLGCFVCVTGVSGSGKSSLVNEIIYKKLANVLNGAKKYPGKHRSLIGIDNLDKIINIDQSPIGRTPRSNPATYTGVFDDIRNLFSLTVESKARGYKPNRFSFNVKGGRCEYCQGDGIIKIEMHFLPDVYIPCDACKGTRYNHETLEVKYKGKSIYDVLEMTIEEAADFFSSIPKIYNKLSVLFDVGLGYIKLGQPATTLSGGEAQRVKLAAELSKKSTGKTIYVLDEPTTGLHTDDVNKLNLVLQKLVDKGNTVLVIEHNLDIIKVADYIIDLGPDGGDAGGEIVICGSPEEVAACDKSYTGYYLKKALEK